MTLKAIIVKDDSSDVYRLLRIGCAEAKKSVGTREHVAPVDFIKRSYGYIIVVELPEKLYGKSSDVRGRKKR